MCKKAICIFIFCLSLFFALFDGIYAGENEIREKLKEIFGEVAVEEIVPADIPGLYAVFTKGNPVFFYDERGYVFFGEIWSINGTNYTVALSVKRALKKLKEQGINPLFYIGKGRKEVYLFMNPECPHCKEVLSHLKKYESEIRIGIYPVMFPYFQSGYVLTMSILCSKNPEEELFNIISGRSFPNVSFATCTQDRIRFLQDTLEKISKLGISSIPILIVDNEVIIGSILPRISQIIEAFIKSGR